ncbi:MAG: DUF2470 domain-containing protein [Gammaproteobacteria bacterium]
MTTTHNAIARSVLLGSAQARFTDAARGRAALTPFCLAGDGSALLCATAGATVSVALARAGRDAVLVLRGRAATLVADGAARSRFRRHHAHAAASPVRLVEPHALLSVGGTRHVIDYATLVADALFDDATETRMVTHMNDDHVAALRDYCTHAGVACAHAPPRMAGIDSAGFFVFADAGLVRFDFPARCADAREVRTALVALAAVARGEGAGRG